MHGWRFSMLSCLLLILGQWAAQRVRLIKDFWGQGYSEGSDGYLRDHQGENAIGFTLSPSG
jgi:hypothetical protein